MSADGVCLVEGVLSRDDTEVLRDCVADELKRAYAAVESDPANSVSRFNVPAETHDRSEATCCRCATSSRSRMVYRWGRW